MSEENLVSKFNFNQLDSIDRSLQRVIIRVSSVLERDELVQQTLNHLRCSLQVDRVVLYYFYRQWKGRVTSESLRSEQYSILGQTGPDECFNGEYAAMYEAGRVRSIADIEAEPIAACHREFLREMQVRANLVVPVLTAKGLWGLLVAHSQTTRTWLELEIELMQESAENLASAPSIRET